MGTKRVGLARTQALLEQLNRALNLQYSDLTIRNVTGSIVTASFFIGDGSNLTGITATASPGGSDTQVQFNSGSSLGGSSNLTFDYSSGTNQLKVVGAISGSNTFHSVGAATFSSTIAASSSVTAGTSFIIGSADLNETDLEKLDGITDGTAAANKAVVLDGSKNIATIGTLGCGAITSTGASTYGSLSGGALSGSSTLHAVGAATFSSTIAASSSISASAFYDTTLGTAINVTGVDSAVDRSLMVANGTSGKAITGSIVTMDPAGNIDAGPTTISANKFSAGGSGVTSTGPISGSSTLHAEGAATFSSTIAATSSVTSAGIYSTGPISGSTTLHAEGAATFSSTIAATSSISASAFYDTTLGTAINVTGVDSATDRSLIVANGTSGKAITGSIVTMDAAGNIDAGPTTIQALKFAAGPSGVTSIGPISGSSTLHAVGAATFSSTIAATGSVTAGSSFIIGSADLNETDLEKLDGITDGTAAGNKAVVLDASKNIATIGTLGCGAITSTGASTYGSLSGGAFSGSTTVQGGDATFSTLHLSGSGETEALRIGKGVSDTKEIVFENAGTDVASIFMNAAETLIIKNESNNDDIQFQTKPGGAATTVMTLDGISAGVGIGTVDPLTKLDVRWDPTGLADDTGGGDVVLFGSGTLTAGKLYYLHTDGAWTEVDADAVATGADQLLGIALGSDPTSDGVLIKGFFDATTYVSNFSKGKAIYVSTTAASMDTTAPSATGDFVRIVGYCTDTANVIYFNPSSEWIELA